jgi:hypothetical protein
LTRSWRRLFCKISGACIKHCIQAVLFHQDFIQDADCVFRRCLKFVMCMHNNKYSVKKILTLALFTITVRFFEGGS